MNPILIDFSHEFHTERLFIRMALPGDGKVVYDAMNASRQDLNKWLEFALFEQTLEQVEQMVREAHIHFLKRIELRFHIFHKKTGEFIGSASLHHINWSVPKFEIGYWIDSRQSGKGYMLEAIEGLTFYAFYALRANRVEILCDSKNVKSRAIPERLGYTLEGTLRNDSMSIDRQELRDSCIYAKIREISN
ncbi:GNAT family N-acetyltransferase [Oceanobacillus arenosus]|uniref:GNAT family N-acetyltransferase n=1 Tax=Oceanobacillus arenosus TaxID=1229153 RepID=A0A3D8PPQ0_9BACI|nr:GNAT family N-acetyltransferase [Oceanobacillus arenosus]RDW17189.1 GNAT family N-acetyltransferase [Oceanobacillus arenosus]